MSAGTKEMVRECAETLTRAADTLDALDKRVDEMTRRVKEIHDQLDASERARERIYGVPSRIDDERRAL